MEIEVSISPESFNESIEIPNEDFNKDREKALRKANKKIIKKVRRWLQNVVKEEITLSSNQRGSDINIKIYKLEEGINNQLEQVVNDSLTNIKSWRPTWDTSYFHTLAAIAGITLY